MRELCPLPLLADSWVRLTKISGQVKAIKVAQVNGSRGALHCPWQASLKGGIYHETGFIIGLRILGRTGKNLPAEPIKSSPSIDNWTAQCTEDTLSLQSKVVKYWGTPEWLKKQKHQMEVTLWKSLALQRADKGRPWLEWDGAWGLVPKGCSIRDPGNTDGGISL
jgi:hypothetical protein